MATKLIPILAAMLEEDSDEEAADINDAFTPLLSGMICCLSKEEKPKIHGYAEEVVSAYDEQTFRRMYRMSRCNFDILFNHLKDFDELTSKGFGGKPPISPRKQLLVTLWYLGSLDTINRIGDRFGISDSSVIMCRDRVMSAVLNHLKQRFISWPDQQQQQDEADHFSRKNGFPNIVGAIDGTHIKIRAPKDKPQSYVNRKNFHSLQLQAVCRHDMSFSHVFTGYPGSCHDARVLRQSDLWEHGLEWCGIVKHIIGDGAYPVRKWLLTPYRDNGHLTQQQKKFNHYLSVNRVVIERAFGLLKGRFRRLLYLDTIEIETAVDVIMTCCVMHNICLLNNDDITDFIEQDRNAFDNIRHFIGFENDAEGFIKRDIIARNLI